VTREDAIRNLNMINIGFVDPSTKEQMKLIYDTFETAIEALSAKPIDKSAMLYEIYMKGVNMTDEYHGCWVRFKDIEKIVDKYMKDIN